MLNKWSYFDALIILKHINSPKQEAYDVRIIDSHMGMPYLGVNGEKDVGNSISYYWQILIDVWKAVADLLEGLNYTSEGMITLSFMCKHSKKRCQWYQVNNWTVNIPIA